MYPDYEYCSQDKVPIFCGPRPQTIPATVLVVYVSSVHSFEPHLDASGSGIVVLHTGSQTAAAVPRAASSALASGILAAHKLRTKSGPRNGDAKRRDLQFF
jgi:hypothetical protein